MQLDVIAIRGILYNVIDLQIEDYSKYKSILMNIYEWTLDLYTNSYFYDYN